ncbi:MAG: DnaD domain protein [Clostridia bacterium]|nr:DnaD domain protein [Clostridia bacterium]
MSLQFEYRNAVLTLPAQVAAELSDATLTELRVLVALAADLSLSENTKELAKAASCREKEAKAAIERWKEAGILRETDEKAAPKKPAKHLRRADEIPLYSTSELADLLEKRESVRALVGEAQSILGKLFTPSETNLVIGLVDYLGLSEEAALLTLAHCKKIGKTNLRAIEKYAISLCDRGITDPAALEEEFLREEALHSFEGELRSLFGMGARALSSKEEKFFKAWTDYGYELGVVKKAYEITVNSTGDASIPYTNAILETWHAAGLSTAEEIDRYLAESSEKKTKGKSKTGPTLGNSFDTDEFFEAALRRSFAAKKKGD